MRFSLVLTLCVLGCLLFIQEGSGDIASSTDVTTSTTESSVLISNSTGSTATIIDLSTTPSSLASQALIPDLYAPHLTEEGKRRRRRQILRLLRKQRYRERKQKRELEKLLRLLQKYQITELEEVNIT